MTLLTRRILIRFARSTLLVVSLAIVLSLAIQLSRPLSRGLDAAALRTLLARQVQALEIAFPLGAALAVTIVLLALKRSGVLTAFFAAGAGGGAIRRPLLVVAVLVAATTAVLQEAAAALQAPRARAAVAGLSRSGDEWRLHVPPAPGKERPARTIRFRANDLAFTVEETAAPGGPPPTAPRPLRPGSLLRHAAAGRGAALLRIAAAALLLLLVAYAALLVPLDGSWAAWLLYLALSLTVVLGTIRATIGLWGGGATAAWAAALWVALLAASVAALDFAFHRRGLRG
jgi:hypothetical protein